MTPATPGPEVHRGSLRAAGLVHRPPAQQLGAETSAQPRELRKHRPEQKRLQEAVTRPGALQGLGFPAGPTSPARAEGSFHSPSNRAPSWAHDPLATGREGRGAQASTPALPMGSPTAPIFSSFRELVTADLAGDEHLKLEWKVPMQCPVGARWQQAESKEAPARSGQREQSGEGEGGGPLGSGTDGPGVLRATLGLA